MPYCSKCRCYMPSVSPNYRGKNPKCDECRYTSDSMVFSDGASPLSDFWEEQERDVSSYAEIGSDAAPAAAAAAAPATIGEMHLKHNFWKKQIF